MTSAAAAAPSAAVLDYEAGNLRSAEKSLERAGFRAFVTADADVAGDADLVVVPGVGHFGQCVRRFAASGFDALIRDRMAAAQPVLGICVGMQILYEGSDEDADVPGFGILPGWVRRIPSRGPAGERLVVPHMGWNALQARMPDPLLDGVDGQHVYFVHSYYADPRDHDHVIAEVRHGVAIPAVAREGSVIGTQFHPEKSADVGRRLLENLRDEVARSPAQAAARRTT